MITSTQGNLLETRAEALVNSVNTVGVMGKGIVLMFKERLPKTSVATPPPARSRKCASAGCSSPK
ncbi:hypothetical protein ABQJ54_11385 [Rhodanobacter sp. Si-c]|uniref:Macro domain-containing protein n=1 Tax=Rhodanobacter lycopersici TaxID=3162487 RepID=A0ABV3QEU3_9GAMM